MEVEEESSEERLRNERKRSEDRRGGPKVVTIEDEPEVFTIVPDSLEVARAERPKYLEALMDTPPEQLTPDKVALLIQETSDIIQTCEGKVLSQKINNAKLGFLLIRIAESIQEYEAYMSRLMRFLVHGDEKTARYYVNVCAKLPSYGDYLVTLSDIVDPNIEVEGVEGLVETTDLRNIVKRIQDNAYNGGMCIQSFRSLNKTIYKHMKTRRQVTEHFTRQIKSWLNLKEAVVDHLDELRERMYSLSAYIHFIRSGDSKIKPVDDVSSLSFEESANPASHSTQLNFDISKFTPIGHSSMVEPLLEKSVGELFEEPSKNDKLPSELRDIGMTPFDTDVLMADRPMSYKEVSMEPRSIFPKGFVQFNLDSFELNDRTTSLQSLENNVSVPSPPYDTSLVKVQTISTRTLREERSFRTESPSASIEEPEDSIFRPELPPPFDDFPGGRGIMPDSPSTSISPLPDEDEDFRPEFQSTPIKNLPGFTSFSQEDHPNHIRPLLEERDEYSEENVEFDNK